MDEIGSLDAGGIKFTLDIENHIEKELHRANRSVDAAAERHERAARKISDHWHKSAEHQKKAVASMTKAHEGVLKAPKITFAVPPVPRFTSIEGGRKAATVPAKAKAVTVPVKTSPASVADMPESYRKQAMMIRELKGRRKGKRREGGGDFEDFDFDEMLGGRGGRGFQVPKTFADIEKSAKKMQEGLSEAKNKSQLDWVSFAEHNKHLIDDLVRKYAWFGKEVPKAFLEAIKAADKYAEKIDAIVKKQTGVFWTVENFIQRMKGLDLKSTALGAGALTFMTKSFNRAEETYKIASKTSKMVLMTQKEVGNRYSEIADVQVKTGATLEELSGVAAGMATGPRLRTADFKEAATTAIELHDATGLATEEAGNLVNTWQQYYDISGKALDEQAKKMAAVSKITGFTAHQQAELYDQLKFVGFGLSDNAKGAKGIADSTVLAASQMSMYGVKAESVVRSITDLTEGGVEEQQKGLMGLILGGKTPEEAMQILTDLQSDIPEVAAKATAALQESKKAQAGVLYGMAGENPFAKAQVRTVGESVFGFGRGEVGKYAAAGKGVGGVAGAPEEKLATLQAGGTGAAALTEAAWKPFFTAMENLEKGKEKAWGIQTGLQAKTYGTLLNASEKFNSAVDSFAGLMPAGEGARGLLGSVVTGVTTGLFLKGAIPALRTVGGWFGKTGGGGIAGEAAGMARGAFPALGQAAETGVAGAAGGAGGLVATMGTAVGAASIAAIAGTVLAGAAIGGIVGTLIDKATDQIPFLKKIKAGLFDHILDPFQRIGEVLSGRAKEEQARFTETKTETVATAAGITIEEQAKKNRALIEERKKVGTFGGGVTPAARATSVGPATVATFAPSGANYKDIEEIAAEIGAHVTETVGGVHAPGSKHPLGMAADIRTKDKTETEIKEIMATFQSLGYKATYEKTDTGKRGWTAPHLHVEATARAVTAEMAKKMPASMLPGASTAVAGKTEGEEGIIAELKKQNAMMAQELALLQRGRPTPPNFSREGEALNRGDMGG